MHVHAPQFGSKTSKYCRPDNSFLKTLTHKMFFEITMTHCFWYEFVVKSMEHNVDSRDVRVIVRSSPPIPSFSLRLEVSIKMEVGELNFSVQLNLSLGFKISHLPIPLIGLFLLEKWARKCYQHSLFSKHLGYGTLPFFFELQNFRR